MKKTKTWILWLLAGICFLFLGIMRLIDRKYFTGVCFPLLGVLYFYLSITNYKKGI